MKAGVTVLYQIINDALETGSVRRGGEMTTVVYPDEKGGISMEIRKTKPEELTRLMEMYEEARQFMRETGNPDQWGTKEPRRERIEKDIAEGNSYVCVKDGVIVATFFFCVMEDATYAAIYEGSWMDDSPYGVVHRITTDRKTRGAAAFCLDWAVSRSGGHLRIDTHEKNIVMQKLLKKTGFSYCGIIYVADGTKRLAYEKTRRA